MDSHFGKFRMRGWPNGRGLTLPPHTAYMNDWFRQVSFLTKRVAGPQMNIAIDMSKGTGLYPRDVLMKMMTRPMYKIGLPDGSTLLPQRQGIYPVAFQGCILDTPTTVTLSAGTFTPIAWGTPTKDTAAFYNAIVPTRLTIPPGVNIVQMTASIRTGAGTSGAGGAYIGKNGTPLTYQGSTSNAAVNADMIATGPVPVVAGDYFTFNPFCNAAKAVLAGQTQFKIEVLDAQYPEI